MNYIPDVVTLALKKEQCIGCGMCINVCPHNVFEIHDKKAVITQLNNCMECGACMRNCPTGAILVRAGVGCAAGIINSFLGKSGDCCCSPSDGNNSGCCS